MSAKNSDLDFFDIPTPENDWAKSSQQTPADISSKISAKNDELAFFDMPDPENNWVKPEAPPISEQLENAPFFWAKEAGAGLYAAPSIAAETYRFLASKLQGLGKEQAQEEGREVSDSETDLTNKFVNYIPDLIKDLGEKFPNIFPTHEKAREFFQEKIKKNRGIELPKQPRGAIERGAVGAGESTLGLFLPGSGLIKASSVAIPAATKAADLSEGQQLATNISVPAAISLIESIVKRRYIPPKGLEKLHQEAKALGLTDKQLAPIFATEEQIGRHGNLAKGVKKTGSAFEVTNEALGNVIENLHERPQKFSTGDLVEQIHLNDKLGTTLVDELKEIQKDLVSGSHAQSTKTTELADFISRTIKDIQQNGTNPSKLIGTWREINKTGQGKTALSRVKPALLKTIEKFDPQLAKDLVTTNKLYERFIGNIKEISPDQFNAFLQAGDIQHLIGAIFSGDPKHLTKGILSTLTRKSFQKISSKILTDPNAQSLARNFGKAIRDGRRASAQALVIQFKNYIQKNLPKEYQEIDWDELDIED
jgi:cation transport regulator ChaC